MKITFSPFFIIKFDHIIADPDPGAQIIEGLFLYVATDPQH
jgi:hypothetical protein